MSVANIIDPSTGEIRSDYLPDLPGDLTVAGNGTFNVASGTQAITFTGGLATATLKPNKIYQFQMSALVASTAGSSAIPLVLTVAPSASVVFDLQSYTTVPALAAGQGTTLQLSGLLSSSASTTIVGSINFTSNPAALDTFTPTAMLLTQLT